MKILHIILCCAVCALVMAGCGELRTAEPVEIQNSDGALRPFSFEEAAQTHGEGTPGAKTEGFKNTAAQAIADAQDAIDRAKSEYTIEYSHADVGYDAENDMWMVVFFPQGAEDEILCGGDQTVYMDGSGITRLIVYGE